MNNNQFAHLLKGMAILALIMLAVAPWWPWMEGKQ